MLGAVGGAVDDLGAPNPAQPAKHATTINKIMTQRIPTSIGNRLAFLGALAKQGWLEAPESTVPGELVWMVLECEFMIG